MNKRTRKALEGSIKKWRDIVAGKKGDNGENDCPLCKLFIANLGCTGCPVAERTGQHGCRGTPYSAWADAHNMVLHSFSRSNESLRVYYATNKRLRALAKAELDFLISLRPKRGKK